MKAKPSTCLLIIVCLLSFHTGALAQAGSNDSKSTAEAKINKAKEAPEDFSEYLNARVWETSQSIISKRRDTNQSEAPAISSNSTSLVDRTSVADLFGVGLNLAGLSSESNEMDADSQSVTVSFYALKAAIESANPLDPAYYTKYRNWRKGSVTLGFDYPEDKVGDINERAVIFGLKYNPLDKRDASHPDNALLIKGIADNLSAAGIQFNIARTKILTYLLAEITKPGAPFEKGIPFDITKRSPLGRGETPLPPDVQVRKDFQDALEDTTKFLDPTTFQNVVLPFLQREDIKSRIDDIIAEHIGAVVAFRDRVRGALEEIRKKAQISFSVFTKQRKEDRPDEYQFKLLLDKGVSPRWNFTLNAGFDYVDNKMSEDTKGGIASIASQIHLNRDNLEGAMPWILSFSGEGSWMTKQSPMYVGQAKLTIPLAFGVEFPLSVSFANRTELIKEADVKGRFGFTFDLSRIAQAFSGGLLKKN